jgi:23S rRNA A1618 N6-methylase RlmF
MIRKKELVIGTREELENYFKFINPHNARHSITSRLKNGERAYCELGEKSSVKSMLDACKEKISPISYMITTFRDVPTKDGMDEFLITVDSIYAFISEDKGEKYFE